MPRKLPFNGVKVGRLKMSVAKAIGRRCADIYISETHIAHIDNAHKKELSQLGIRAFDYVKMIVDGYTQILEGSNNSILLVVKTNSNIHHAAAISLNYCTKKGVWEVKTAQPRSSADLQKRKMLWQNCPSPA